MHLYSTKVQAPKLDTRNELLIQQFFYHCRMKKRMSTLLHTHVALLILTICAVLDAGCVIGQIIADILIMKGKLPTIAVA